jgi:outer membrane protein TolC
MTNVNRWSLVLFLMLAVAAVWANAGSADPSEPNAPRKPEVVESLQKEKVEILVQLRDVARKQYEQGVTPLADVLNTEQQVLLAQLDLAKSAKERVALRAEYAKAAEKQFEIVVQLHKSSVTTKAEVFRAQIALIDARIALERERAGGH